MGYEGPERRQGCNRYCEEHTGLIANLSSIEQKMDDLIDTIKTSGTFRTAIVCALIGCAMSIILVWGDYKLNEGKIDNQIQVDSKRLDIIESKIFVVLDRVQADLKK